MGATVACVAPRDHVGGNAPLPVGGACQRNQAPVAGDEVLHLDRVAHREDIGLTGAHLLVDPDAAALAERQPGRLRQRGVRTHAKGEDHDVGGMDLARLRLDIDRSAGRRLETGHAVAELQAHAVALHEALDDARHVDVQRAEQLRAHFDQRDIEAAVHQVLGRLQPDEAAADHDGACLGPLRLEAGVFVHA